MRICSTVKYSAQGGKNTEKNVDQKPEAITAPAAQNRVKISNAR